MKRAVLLILFLAICIVPSCARRYAKPVSKTVCEVWIYSLPQGARLYLRGNYVGRTPYKYTSINDGDSSAHFIVRDLSEIVSRKRGYDDEVEVITVANCYKKLNIQNEGVLEQVKLYKGNITMYMDEKEAETKEEYGNLVIEAVPQDPNAEIYINDNFIGNGKTSLLKLPAGSYVLKVRKPGYKPYARIISVLADNDLEIKAILKKVTDEDDEMSVEIETDELELSPAGKETEIEEDAVPGTIGGKD